MEQTITVKYVNQVKPGKKLGSIKTSNDEIIGVEPQDLRLFQPGGVYDINYEDISFKGGGGMKKFVSMAASQAPSQPTSGPQTQSPSKTQEDAQARKTMEIAAQGAVNRYVHGCLAVGVAYPAEGDLAEYYLRTMRAWTSAAQNLDRQERCKDGGKVYDESLNDRIPF